MSAKHRVAPHVCVRTPLLSLDALDGGESAAEQRAHLDGLLRRADVAEALYLASPALHGQLEVWRSASDSAHGRQIERSLVKYVTRMATRATPFGLFAGVGVGTIEGRREVEIAVGAPAAHGRRTRVDNELLFQLAAQIAREPAARAALTWRPNTSLARVAGSLRYAEARTVDGALRYHLVSVEPTPYLDATLARAAAGARLDELAGALDGEPDEATAYVDALADAQILVPSLGVSVTGPEPIDAMIDQLAAAGLDEHAGRLVAVRARLAAIDGAGLGVAPARYDEVLALLEAAFAAAGDARRLEPARLVQADLSIEVAARIGTEVVAEIERAVEVLRRLTPRRFDDALATFRREFRARWEDREVPLAEVLDEESGIGFAAATGPGSEGAPLLAGLPFGGASAVGSTPWGARETWLLGQLVRAWTSGADELVLDAAAIRALEASEPAMLPDAWSVMARIGHRDGAPALLVEGAGGPSGARVLGRFCHVDDRIDALVRSHLAAEEALQPDVVFAEVVHLAEGRNGNILCRPVLRAHELVYLGLGGAAPERQLGLDDLRVSVRDDRVVLRSRRLGREVMPRLTSAHNVHARGLGVYRFLAAVQAQDGAGVAWSWGPFADAPRLPRVRSGRTVLARAQWTLGADELAPLARAAAGSAVAGFDAVQALRGRLGLPRHVVVVDGDNELWVDLDHRLQVDAFVDAVGGRARAALCEVYPAIEDAVARGPGGRFASEVVLAFVREAARARPAAPARVDAGSIARRFPPGSPWLYAKLYGGVSTADRVLREAVAPVVRAAQADGAAARWFFIRYADPAPHLRVRVAGAPARLLNEVLPALERACAPLLADGTLWRIQLDTYERELERYGGAAAIEACEDIFWRDSEAALTIVEHLDGDDGAEARWQLALRGGDDLLRALGLDAAARADVFTRARDALAAEHGGTTELRRALGRRWRELEPRLTGLLARDPVADAADVLAPGLRALAARDAALRGVGPLPGLDGFAWSLVHMSANRLLHASQRAQELVIYDLLRRAYARQRALARPARREEAA